MSTPIRNLISRKLINLQTDITEESVNPIGEKGGFGEVYRAKFRKKHHGSVEIIDCAVKYIKTKPDPQEDFELFRREVSAQDLIKHPALLPLLGFSVPICGIGKFAIVTPYMKNGSLWNILDKEKHHLAPSEWSDAKRMIMIIGVAAGLCAMHRKSLVHRDIKPQNILFDEKLYPKIGDFGFSKIFEEGLEEMLQRTNCGTENYVAPEFLVGDGTYNAKVDVFAYGILLYEILSLKSFGHECKKNKKTYLGAMASGYRPDLSDTRVFTPSFKELIENCWQTESKNRPSFDEILNSLLKIYEKHEFIEQNDEVDVYIVDSLECLGFNVDFC